MANERVQQSQPLLSVNDSITYDAVGGDTEDQSRSPLPIAAEPVKNSLGTLNGVFVPCCLTIMGIILFLRFGWSVGQGGVLGTFGIIAVAEAMALLTVLSFSAIVTNGNMRGGGSYFMISRSLGPEFGGAIGILFYAAYAVGVSFYVVGFATEVQSTFFSEYNDDAKSVIQIVGTFSLMFCFGVSWVGADAFAKLNVWFFAVQYFAVVWSIVSIWMKRGFSVDKFAANLYPQFTDTVTGTDEVNSMCDGTKCNFQMVFAVIFPAATGIMEGANLSGDLKDPGKSIPYGTLLACFSAILTYIILVITLAGGFHRKELTHSMTVLQDEALVSPYIIVFGICTSALSSALGSLFGGSRVLQAVARDKLFPGLDYFGQGTAHGDEPRRAVVITYLIAQCCVLIGNLDIIAPIITAFFLISYALCNLTAFALSVTGAPNFRPMFTYYSWQLSLLGFLMCMFVLFYLNPLNSAVALILLFAIFVFIWLRHPATNWGDVSQALMYHQVRKYLLRLDETAEHAKFWRPSIVLFLDDMRTDMIDFCGTLKKGGLLVLGNVLVGELADLGEESIRMRKSWLSFINVHKLKAFPQVTVAPSLRVGYQFLMQGSGLGGLRCNTIALPFYDAQAAKRQPSLDGYSQVNITRSPSFYRDVGTELSAGAAPFQRERTQSEGLNDILEELSERRPAGGRSSSKNAQRLARVNGELPVADSGEYIGIIKDALTLEKNVLVCRNFCWTKQKDTKKFIDIWFEDEWEGSCNDSKALMLQLGAILILKDNKKKERLRVMQVLKKTQYHADDILKKVALERQLADYRIRASVVQVYLRVESGVVSGTAEYENSLRELISDNVADTSVLFLQLPKLPKHIVKTAYTRDHSDRDAILASDEYLKALCRMTEGIPVALVRAGEKADIISTSI